MSCPNGTRRRTQMMIPKNVLRRKAVFIYLRGDYFLRKEPFPRILIFPDVPPFPDVPLFHLEPFPDKSFPGNGF